MPSNIAKDADLNIKPKFVKFLGYAKGSMAELRIQNLIVSGLEYLNDRDAYSILEEAEKLFRMLYRLTQTQQSASS